MANFEQKYLVVKRADISKHLDCDEQFKLGRMLEKIRKGRRDDGKDNRNRYLICNRDEPYAKAVKEIILAGETMKVSRY